MRLGGGNNVPSAIVGFGACASVVYKKTLENKMRVIAIKGVKYGEICQPEHQLCSSGEPLKTICPVRMPFQYSMKGSSEQVRFHIRFDVISGVLPSLIALPLLKAMRAAYRFIFNNLSLAVHNYIRRLDLIHHSSHLHLPLQGTITYSCTLPEKQSLSTNTTQTSNQFHSVQDKCYYLPGPMSKRVDISVSLRCQNYIRAESKISR